VDVWGVVLAAGDGRRFGGRKQFETLAGRRLVDRVTETAASACDAVVVVIPAGVASDSPPASQVVAGGATRAESVRNALSVIPYSALIIVISDAAHPLTTRSLFASVIDAVRDGHDAAVPVVPVNEVVKRVHGDRVVDTLPWPDLVTTQTPQAFRAEILRAAHAQEPDAAEDSLLVEAVGGHVTVVPGDPRNLHVTTPADLKMAAQLIVEL
jgi:2-C-methyl-D-erythritol 4-phosphate cytidylyltransferase